MDNLSKIKKNINETYCPLLFKLNIPADKQLYNTLLKEGKVSFIHDEIDSQLRELIKVRNPTLKLQEHDYPNLILNHLNGKAPLEYGVWVYYPWNQRLVHILDEDEFIEVRTNRNQNKITKAEQAILRTKKIGIAGLSVGQSIALTIAMERICGEIRLTDFDTAELSNLNRVRTGIHNLGINKSIIAAREIKEIDPYIKIRIFTEGLHNENTDIFFIEGGKLDLFIEVCDGIQVKIDSRFKAKALKIPVVMDTNDRGMLDIERFDLEPDRSIFHGLLNGFIKNNSLKIDSENRSPVLMSILSFDSLSNRMKTSMEQIGKTINTWPQLASSVVLGGAITTDISRQILLDQHHLSGRYYVDLDHIFNQTGTMGKALKTSEII